MALTNAQRQARYRAQKTQKLVQVSGYVPASAVPELQAAMRMLAANPDLVVSLLRDTVSGRVVSIKRA